MIDKTSSAHPSAEIIRTHAERLRHEAEERQQQRLVELAEQRSSVNSPSVRIRAWEKSHALRLPDNPAHPVLRAVARNTGLTLAQVQEEQRARKHPQRAGAQERETSGLGLFAPQPPRPEPSASALPPADPLPPSNAE